MTDPSWPPPDPMFPDLDDAGPGPRDRRWYDTYGVYGAPGERRWSAELERSSRPYDDGDGLDLQGGELVSGDRLTHLVLVDGRLVDVWSEPVEPTRWAAVARAFDRARRPTPAPPPPEPPRHESVLAWLDDVVGGRAALVALTTDATQGPVEAPDVLPGHLRDRWQAVRDLVTAVADECFDPAAEAALHRALDRLVLDDPQAVAAARSAASLAGALCWIVGKANGLFGGHAATQSGVRDLLGLSAALSTLGPPLQRSFGTPWPASARPYGSRGWYGAPDLLATGCVDVLTDRTRRMVVRMRDRALEEAARTTRPDASDAPEPSDEAA